MGHRMQLIQEVAMSPLLSVARRVAVVVMTFMVVIVAGIASAEPADPQIVGGQEADPGEWPWQVLLVKRGYDPSAGRYCGGSLIDRSWVLTAAHCVDDRDEDDLDVVAGIHNLVDPDPNIHRIAIAEIIVHPNYEKGGIAHDNDIALLRLKTPILDRSADGETLPIARAILMPYGLSSLVGKEATVTGWGSLQSGGASPDALQEVVVPIVSNSDCQEFYDVYDDVITGNMLCAGYEEGGHDSCQGDSGGPLVIYNSAESRWEQVGIVSWGRECARPNVPGVYAHLSNDAVNWIQGVMLRRIAFVIDDTGSMSEEINDVKTTVTQKVDEFAARSLAFQYHLITFKDSVNYRGQTSDPATIKNWVNGLSASGGGDCPEEMLGALNRLAEEAPDSEAWVMTDAGFHGGAGDLLVTIYNLVRARVRVHPIVYGWCFSRQAQDATTTGPGRAAALGGESFAQIASETGGHYFLIDSDETLAATNILLNEMTAPSDLMLYQDEVAGTKEYDLDVDPTADSINLMLNLSEGLADLEVRKPNGEVINASTPGVVVTTLGNVRYFQIATPVAGRWQASVIGSAKYAFSVSGETEIDFRYIGDTTLTIDVPATIQARLVGPVASASFQLIRPDGTAETALSLFDDGAHGDNAANDGLYGGIFTPEESGSYFLRVKGTASGGSAFERTSPEMIRVHGLHVRAPLPQSGAPGQEVTYQFAVSNNGPIDDTIDLSAVSTLGWILTHPPAFINLAANEVKLIAVTLKIPADAEAGVVDELVLAASSRTNPLVNDVASVLTTVGAVNAPVFLPLSISVPPTLTNGNFEAGRGVGWQEYSSNNFALVTDDFSDSELVPHSGAWLAWLGGVYNETSILSQSVTVPAATPILSYYHVIQSADACGNDRFVVRVGGQAVVTTDLCRSTQTGGWARRTINLSSRAGQAVLLEFVVTTNGEKNSNLFIDDVSFVPAAAAAQQPEESVPAAGGVDYPAVLKER